LADRFGEPSRHKLALRQVFDCQLLTVNC